MKILILGHARHGKDSAAHFIAGLTGFEFQSSSMFACEKFLFERLKDKYNYKTPRDCFNDRHNKREEWYNSIKEYNTPDKSKLCRELLKEYDIYIGMRDDKEYESSKNLFDYIFWVDASGRKPKDPTMKIEYDEDDHILINNNDSLEYLFHEIEYELKFIR